MIYLKKIVINSNTICKSLIGRNDFSIGVSVPFLCAVPIEMLYWNLSSEFEKKFRIKVRFGYKAIN